MNVLMIINTLSVYGANRSLFDMIQQLRTQNIHVIVLVYEHGEFEKQLHACGIQTELLPYKLCVHGERQGNVIKRIIRLCKNLSYLSQAKRIVEKHHIDIIHTNASNVDFGALLSLKCGIPHVWHIRELLYADYRLKYDFPMLEKVLFKKTDKMVCISEYVQRERKLNGSNSIALYDGFEVSAYATMREEIFRGETTEILYSGVISEEKGTKDCILAVESMIEQGYSNVHLSIVGSESAYWHELEQYIEKHQLENYITYYGYQQDMRPFREKADIAVISSRSEGLGRVTVESMLGGVLVVCTNCGANPELVQEGKTGYMYEPGNGKQLGEIIQKCRRETEKSREIVRNAMVFALKEFDSEQYGKRMIEIYKECMEKKDAGKKGRV